MTTGGRGQAEPDHYDLPPVVIGHWSRSSGFLGVFEGACPLVPARVFDELDEIAKLEDPRSRGKALTGNLAGVWRYRVGDYRILCDINDGRLVILVVDVAHRREVYKRR